MANGRTALFFLCRGAAALGALTLASSAAATNLVTGQSFSQSKINCARAHHILALSAPAPARYCHLSILFDYDGSDSVLVIIDEEAFVAGRYFVKKRSSHSRWEELILELEIPGQKRPHPVSVVYHAAKRGIDSAMGFLDSRSHEKPAKRSTPFHLGHWQSLHNPLIGNSFYEQAPAGHGRSMGSLRQFHFRPYTVTYKNQQGHTISGDYSFHGRTGTIIIALPHHEVMVLRLVGQAQQKKLVWQHDPESGIRHAAASFAPKIVRRPVARLAKLCGEFEFLSESEGAIGLWLYSDAGNYFLNFTDSQQRDKTVAAAPGTGCARYRGPLPDPKESYVLEVQGFDLETAAH